MYCSRKCYFDQPKKQFTCEVCGEAYWLTDAAIAKKARDGVRPRCCSRKCWIAMKRRSNATICCARCGKQVAVKGHKAKQQFCSTTCLRIAESEKWRHQRVRTHCDVCEKPIDYTEYEFGNRQRHFCSRECMSRNVGDWAISTGFRDGVRADIGFYVRSSWEANVARFFAYMGWMYEYEPRRFRLANSWYTPDFNVNGYWVEVKGQMRTDAARKIAEFRILYPNESLVILDQALYQSIEKEFSERIPCWDPTYARRRRAKMKAT